MKAIVGLVQLNVRVPVPLAEAVRAASLEDELGVQDIMRRALKLWLKRREGKAANTE